jgi:heat shock protein HspQ
MKQAKFAIGQCIQHRKFDYRGVVVDVDPEFQGTSEQSPLMTAVRMTGTEPWYHILVDNSGREAYVSEHNLVGDDSGEPISHPLLKIFLVESGQGNYQNARQLN